jgi:nucleotidyltransferase/DNA polymerase involved in DNA repair
VSGSRIVVHVTVERFRWACRGQGLDGMVSLTEELGKVLDRHATGWTRPSADEAFLVSAPLAGATAPLRAPMDWVGSLRDAIASELRLDSSFGIASTLIAARLCSRMARPRGILLWMPGQERRLLDGLPLEDLDELRPDQLAKLRSSGVRTLDELACLDTDEAHRLLGVESQRLLALVRGADRVVERENGGRLARATELLSRRLARRLASSRRRARGLELQVLYQDGVVRETYVLLARATSEVADLQSAGQRLVAMTPRRPDATVGLALTATGLTSTSEGNESPRLAGFPETSPLQQLALFSFARELPREVRVALGRIPESSPVRARAHTGGAVRATPGDPV